MKLLAAIFAIVTLFLSFFTRTDSINHLITDAEKEYVNQNYERAAIMYDSLLHFYEIGSAQVKWNLASSWLKASNYDSAYKYFEQLSVTGRLSLQSASLNQLGLIAYYFKDNRSEAISQFKKALKIDPHNQEAIYNLELLQKTGAESPPSSPAAKDSIRTMSEKKQKIKAEREIHTQRSNQAKGNRSQTSGSSSPGIQESEKKKFSEGGKNKEEDTSASGKLITQRKSNQDINPERILELMRQNETRYLQQIKRRSQEAPIDTGPAY